MQTHAASSPSHRPLLLSSLRATLACLYGLPTAATNSSPQGTPSQQQEANSFLIAFQSRNIRRRIESVIRSQKSLVTRCQESSYGQYEEIDEARAEEQEDDNDDEDQQPIGRNSARSKDIHGSTWLACIVLLCCTPDAHPSERLFAAQTLLHRTRRFDIEDAVDVEFDPAIIDSTEQQHSVDPIFMMYSRPHHSYTALFQWTRHFYPPLCQIMFPNGPNDQYSHAQWKAEVAILCMSGVVSLTAYHTSIHENTHSLLTTLGGAISLTAVRMKYTPKSVHMAPDSVRDFPPLVSMVTSSIRTASTEVQPYLNTVPSSIDQDLYQAVLISSICASLAELPDALLGSVGGARGKLSLDPKCIYAAAAEIRHPATGVDLLLETFAGIPLNSAHLHASMLSAVQKWACFVPLTVSFVEKIMPLVLLHLNCDEENMTLMECTKTAYALLIAVFEGACLTEEQVIALSVGLSKSNSNSSNSQSPTGCKTRGKAKKRREQKLNSLATQESSSAAAQECLQRKEVACQVAFHTLSHLKIAVSKSLAEAAADPDAMIDGEASIATVCAAASAVLPHLVTMCAKRMSNDLIYQHVVEIFTSILDTLYSVCASPNKNVRRLAHDSIIALHSALIEIELWQAETHQRIGTQDSEPVMNLAIDGVFKVSPCSFVEKFLLKLQ